VHARAELLEPTILIVLATSCATISVCHWHLMRFAIGLPNFGEYSDPHILAQLACEAEDAGWDGCFIWDHIQVERSVPVGDPWIALAAMALMTKRIRIALSLPRCSGAIRGKSRARLSPSTTFQAFRRTSYAGRWSWKRCLWRNQCVRWSP